MATEHKVVLATRIFLKDRWYVGFGMSLKFTISLTIFLHLISITTATAHEPLIANPKTITLPPSLTLDKLESAAASASAGSARVIAVRVVQIVSGTNGPALTLSQLKEQFAGLNQVFRPAGLVFCLCSQYTITNAEMSNLSTGNYGWKQPLSQNSFLAFNPGCSLSPPASEPKQLALFRAATFCAADGDIVVFIVEQCCNGSHGPYPWEANGIIMQRTDMAAGNRTFAHETGHYLGLPHVFRGGSGQYDLTNANLINPQTGNPAQLSDFWDLILKPAGSNPVTSDDLSFNSKADAAQYEASLQPIQIQSNDGTLCDPAFLHDPCPSKYPSGTLQMPVGTDGNIWYTGDPGMKGLAFIFSEESRDTIRGVNVMSYNYTGQASRFSVSQSQVEQIKRVLQYDISTAWFPSATGRRPKLGLPQNGSNDVLITYDFTSGAGAIGHLTAAGTIYTIGQQGAGTFGKWTHIVGLGDGRVIFYNSTDRSGAVGSISDNGAIATDSRQGAGSFDKWTHIVGLGGNRLFYYNDVVGAGAVAHVTMDGAVVTDGQQGPGTFGKWTHIVGLSSGQVLFYNAADGSGAVGHVTASGTVVTDGHQGPGSFGKWTQIVGLGGGRVFYFNAADGSGAVGHISSDSTIATDGQQGVGTFGKWTHLVGFADGRVFAYNAADGSGAVGHVTTDGTLVTECEQGQGVFSTWTLVVAVR